MKIMIPVNNVSEGKYDIAKGFINSDVACVYDCKNKTYEWLNNNELSANVGNLSLELKRRGIYTIISSHISIMALGLFVESGMNVYKAHGTDVLENIKLYEADQLETFTSALSMKHNGCSPVSCASCASTTCN